MTDRITDPGKFEGEPTWVPYFWDQALLSLAETDVTDAFDRLHSFFVVNNDDRTRFPALANVYGVVVFETEQGFVESATYPNEDLYLSDIWRIENDITT